VKTPSTAAAVEAVSSSVLGTSAAIGSKLSAQLFDGIELLYEGIQDENCELLFFTDSLSSCIVDILLIVNFTRFYVIANSRTAELPLFSTEATVSRGLFRIYCPTSSAKKPQITRVLDALQLQVTRIDRRPRIGAKSFDDIYFVEVEDDEIEDSSMKSDGNGTLTSWTNRLDLAKARIHDADGEVTILGSWPC
jgi:prephenate dehydratase